GRSRSLEQEPDRDGHDEAGEDEDEDAGRDALLEPGPEQRAEGGGRADEGRVAPVDLAEGGEGEHAEDGREADDGEGRSRRLPRVEPGGDDEERDDDD